MINESDHNHVAAAGERAPGMRPGRDGGGGFRGAAVVAAVQFYYFYFLNYFCLINFIQIQ